MATLQDLPNELWEYIFTYADFYTLDYCERVCTLFYSIIQSSTIYKDKTLQHFRHLNIYSDEMPFGSCDLSWKKLCYCTRTNYLILGANAVIMSNLVDNLNELGLCNIDTWVTTIQKSMPSKEYLFQYDAILVYYTSESTKLYDCEHEEISSYLTQYIDSGRGGVALLNNANVECACYLGYEFEQKGYHPFLAETQESLDTTRVIYEDHFIMHGYDTEHDRDYQPKLKTILLDGKVIAKYENGNILVATKEIGPNYGRVCSLNMRPKQDGEKLLLIVNALLFCTFNST